MMISSGYTLQVECDCPKCRDAPYESIRERAVFFSDEAYSKTRCFDQARRAGWVVTRTGICYAPGHERDLKLEKQWRSGNEIEMD